MKRISLGIIMLVLASVLRGEVSIEALAKTAAQNVCKQEVVLLEQLKTYVEKTQLEDKKDILYQLNLLKTCLAAEETRLSGCSLEQLADALRATELVVENFEKNIPGQVAHVCSGPVAAPAETKMLSAAEMLERYNKLQERIQKLVKKITELNMGLLDRLLNRSADLYNGQKEWLEPVLAATIFGLAFWKAEAITQFMKENRLALAPVVALAFYLRAQKRSTIAGLKNKLPAAIYYPLALCKWAVGSHEKAIRVALPYGVDINVAEIRAWVAEQEKRCGQSVAIDEDKTTAPCGLGSVAKFFGMKNEISAPFSFIFGANGIALSALAWQSPEKK